MHMPHPPQLTTVIVLRLGLQPASGRLDGGVAVGGGAPLHPSALSGLSVSQHKPFQEIVRHKAIQPNDSVCYSLYIYYLSSVHTDPFKPA